VRANRLLKSSVCPKLRFPEPLQFVPPTCVAAATFLLSVALAAMGLERDIGKLAAKGLRPALLGAFAFLFIAGFSLTLIELMG
jgi:uncharacterized membrane protein YadS